MKMMLGLRRRGSGGPSRSAWALLAAPMTAVVLVAVGCSGSGAPAPPGPAAAAADTPAGAQLRWLIAAAAHPPMSDAEIRAHFDAGYLAAVGLAELNQGLQGLAGARLVSTKVGEPASAA